MKTLYASVQGNARAKKWEWVGGEVHGGACGGPLGPPLDKEAEKSNLKDSM